MTTHCGVCTAHYTEPCNLVVHGVYARAAELEARVAQLEGAIRKYLDDYDFDRNDYRDLLSALGPPPDETVGEPGPVVVVARGFAGMAEPEEP